MNNYHNKSVGEKILSTDEVYIIAEVGNNHLGDYELALKHLQAAAEANVDAVKYQLFTPELLVTAETPVYKHVPDNTFATQRERFKHMCLGKDDFIKLSRAAEDLNVDFLCTPFDIPSADFLNPLVSAFKIASGDTSNFTLIDYVANFQKTLIVSSGLCEQNEVDDLVARLPKERSSLLHCIGSYPTPDDQVNLALIPFYQQRYNVGVGYSDHTKDNLACLAAAALGATILEKHFILDRSLPGGDRDLSATPQEMKSLVDEVRRLQNMRGSSPRRLMPAEIYGRTNLRRSPYALRAAKAGETLVADDIVYLRPEIKEAWPLPKVMSAGQLILTQDVEEETLLTPENSKLLME